MTIGDYLDSYSYSDSKFRWYAVYDIQDPEKRKYMTWDLDDMKDHYGTAMIKNMHLGHKGANEILKFYI